MSEHATSSTSRHVSVEGDEVMEDDLARLLHDLPESDWSDEEVDAFHAVARAFFDSALWFVWCGEQPLHIVNDRGEVARYAATKLAIKTLVGMGWGPR